MENKKSDFRKFCETMLVIVKYDILPRVAIAALCAGLFYGLYNHKKSGKDSFTKDAPEFFQKQR